MVDVKKMLKDLPKGTYLQAPIFEMYIMPNGLLTPDPVEHALFYYYVNARKVYEDFILNQPIIMEGDPDPEYNFRQLFTSTAALYGVKPEEMYKAWSVIDRQVLSLNLPLLPDEYQYRFVSNKRILLQ